MFEWIGWVATATFASSYFFQRPAILRRIQALAAVLWIGYGVIIHALPVVVANVVVAAVAIFSSLRNGGSPARSRALDTIAESE